jgi:cardiolipin synthase
VGFTGGYNLADEYFNLTHPFGMWKDTGIRLEGDAVPSLTVAFLEMWNAGKRKADEYNDTDFAKYLPYYGYQATQNGFVQPYADSPMDNKRIGEDVYISMAEKATKYCWFATPYLIVTDEMTHALTLAAKRGVDVRIITPGIPDKKLVYSMTRSFYPALVRGGVRIYEWTPGFLHCKMSVADDKMSVCGTINLDYRSLYHHFENACWIHDPAIAGNIRDDFNNMFAESREVTEEYRSGESAVMKVSQLVLRLFAQLM